MDGLQRRNEELRRRHDAGESFAHLGRQLGISGWRVSQVVGQLERMDRGVTQLSVRTSLLVCEKLGVPSDAEFAPAAVAKGLSLSDLAEMPKRVREEILAYLRTAGIALS